MPPRPRRASPAGRLALGAICALLVGAALATFLGLLPSWVTLPGLVALSVVIAAGVALPGSGVFARPLLSVETSRPEVALTFDDGPDPVWTRRILDLLDASGQRATFFVIGSRAAHHPELLAEIARRGHELANHSFDHAYTLTFHPPRRIAEELERTSRLIESASGQRPRWFRPPVGLLSPRIAAGVEEAGLELVAWTASARDGVARTTVEQALNRLQSSLRPGAILVLHDTPMRSDREPIAPAVLEALLARMKTAGLRSVTLSELSAST